jgi:protein SCO1/2
MTFTAAAITACVIAAAPAGAFAQGQEHTGHEQHMAQMKSAGKEPEVRLMTPQPALDGIDLVDQAGRPTTLREAVATDKPVLVNFIFTSCTTICPVMSAGMSQFLANLGADEDGVRVVTISIDPEHDTAEVLRSYAARYHAPSSWRFLTGAPAAVDAAQRAFGAYRGGKNNHVAATFVRPSPAASWIALDGFSSAETLQHAAMGHLVPRS